MGLSFGDLGVGGGGEVREGNGNGERGIVREDTGRNVMEYRRRKGKRVISEG